MQIDNDQNIELDQTHEIYNWHFHHPPPENCHIRAPWCIQGFDREDGLWDIEAATDRCQDLRLRQVPNANGFSLRDAPVSPFMV